MLLGGYPDATLGDYLDSTIVINVFFLTGGTCPASLLIVSATAHCTFMNVDVFSR